MKLGVGRQLDSSGYIISVAKDLQIARDQAEAPGSKVP